MGKLRIVIRLQRIHLGLPGVVGSLCSRLLILVGLELLLVLELLHNGLVGIVGVAHEVPCSCDVLISGIGLCIREGALVVLLLDGILLIRDGLLLLLKSKVTGCLCGIDGVQNIACLNLIPDADIHLVNDDGVLAAGGLHIHRALLTADDLALGGIDIFDVRADSGFHGDAGIIGLLFLFASGDAKRESQSQNQRIDHSFSAAWMIHVCSPMRDLVPTFAFRSHCISVDSTALYHSSFTL